MARKSTNGKADEGVRQIHEALAPYETAHPKAKVEVRRQNPVSVRIRMIDPDFHGMDRVDRDSLVWGYLDHLPEEVQSDITLLLLFTPDEAGTALANIEFDDPVPSHL